MEIQTYGRGAARTLFALAAATFISSQALAQNVSTEAELRSAYLNAQPGAVITLADGTYTLNDRLSTRRGGTESSPIIVRSASPNGAVIVTNGAQQAFQVMHPWWRFENLYVHVTRATPYGYKIELDGHHVTVSGGKIEIDSGSEAGVKGSGSADAPWPDFATIENLEIFMTSPTSNYLAEGIDAVAVDGWVIRKNIIHGMRTTQRGVAFGAMTKGNCSNTTIEENLFYDNFISISFGGGGTGGEWMRNHDGSLESRGGIIRNNMSLDSDDVAVYLYSAADAKVYNNTFFNSYQTCGSGCASIDVRNPGASADIRNNILDKPIRDREGGTSTRGSNMTLPSPTDSSWFVDVGSHNLRLRAGVPPIDSGEALSSVQGDIDLARRPYGAAYDIGAHEFGASNPGNPMNPPPDVGNTNPPPNSGNTPPDAGVPENPTPPNDPGTNPAQGETGAPPANDPPTQRPPADESAAPPSDPASNGSAPAAGNDPAAGSTAQGLANDPGGAAQSAAMNRAAAAGISGDVNGGCRCIGGTPGSSALAGSLFLLLPLGLVARRRNSERRLALLL